MLNADIEVWRDVVVLRDHISRGEKVRNSSLTLQQRNIGKLRRGYYTEFKDITGHISKRSLKAGTAVNPSMISLPIIVQRGQALTLRVERPSFTVNMKGIALKKGRKGDSIKVKNSSSNKVLFGIIIHRDLVLIN
jgi:flagella basal body P-ring formation protein FlgA